MTWHNYQGTSCNTTNMLVLRLNNIDRVVFGLILRGTTTINVFYCQRTVAMLLIKSRLVPFGQAKVENYTAAMYNP
jgi:hypothetical protein